MQEHRLLLPLATAMTNIDSNAAPFDRSTCPRCHRDKLVHLKSMRQYDTREWFKCDGCEHIFTRPASAPAPINPQMKSA
jgi:transposase-like protein